MRTTNEHMFTVTGFRVHGVEFAFCPDTPSGRGLRTPLGLAFLDQGHAGHQDKQGEPDPDGVGLTE